MSLVDILKAELAAQGETYAVEMGAAIREILGGGAIDVQTTGVSVIDPGETPADLPAMGWLVTQRAQPDPSKDDIYVLGIFLPLAIHEAAVAQQPAEGEATEEGDEEDGGKELPGLGVLAPRLSEMLQSDRCGFVDLQAAVSEDMWNDYLAGDLPAYLAWQRFDLTGVGDEPQTIYIAWPWDIVEAMFSPEKEEEPASAPAPPQPAAPPMGAPAASPAHQPPSRPISPAVKRVLRTQVPVIVTLAQKNENASKILQLGPGSIIEFNQSCEEPLTVSVNNLPIGLCEAVKVGDHFGLRIVSVVPVEERLERLGTKWNF